MEGELVYSPEENFVPNQDFMEEYATNIDFDTAQKAWRSNKKVCENCTFAYRCSFVISSGKVCNKVDCKTRGRGCV